MSAPTSERNVVVFGAGRIGVAVARGLAAAGQPPERLWVTTRTGATTGRTEGLRVALNREAAEFADLALICTKPQDVSGLIDEIGPRLRPETIVVSLASGLPTGWFEARLSPGTTVVRVMTTLAIEAGCGTSVISGGKQAGADDLALVAGTLRPGGATIEAPEDYLDAVSAVSGAALAYVYFLVEGMTQAGVSVGLPNELARALLIQAVVGAGELMSRSGRHPVQLREDVMSRGGQTIAGLRELERHNVRTALFDAVTASRDRGLELAAELAAQTNTATQPKGSRDA